MRDPIGANLDRIQVIKGWIDDRGNLQEKVYDVAWSGDRQGDANGKLPPVGNTVDIEAANWTNTTGASELAAIDNVELLVADNPRKDRRDNRQEGRDDNQDGRQEGRDDRRDCRQEEGRIGDDKRDCKQEERGEGGDEVDAEGSEDA